MFLSGYTSICIFTSDPCASLHVWYVSDYTYRFGIYLHVLRLPTPVIFLLGHICSIFLGTRCVYDRDYTCSMCILTRDLFVGLRMFCLSGNTCSMLVQTRVAFVCIHVFHKSGLNLFYMYLYTCSLYPDYTCSVCPGTCV